MNPYPPYRNGRVLWGLLLIGLGVLFLLDRFDIVEVEDLVEYWPFILVAIGINRMAGYSTARNFTSGFFLVFLGLWLFAIIKGVFGITLENSWPFLLIAAGVGMVLAPVVDRHLASRRQPPPDDTMRSPPDAGPPPP